MTKWLAMMAILFSTQAISSPAGLSEPLILRQVTLNGTVGPAYYSRIEEGYRFVSVPKAEENARLAGMR
ncbi:hypothetical protein [Aurantimonas sp. Leaf443]|uniref:hypothetical protein n=1 Tax=Aurantimonas sp. Leaf443 TaxID=1736378 RepID=UPI0006F5B85A|nr:hypothetical protein [Aurantimonas sp. Leaf443]KQT85208.1 hypothetical protein ASG48_08055 [Aurantimonas sp. Leaf443]